MWRHALCAMASVAICVGISMADEMRVVITKVDGNNITFAEFKGKGKKGDPQTLPAADNVKVTKAVFNKDTKKVEAGDAIEGGLKNEIFRKINAEKGVAATIVTDADNKKIIEIHISGGKGGK